MERGTFAFKILKDLGVVSSSGAYTKRLAVVKYGTGKTAKIRMDLRTWLQTEDEGEKMCKGICLTKQEAEKLYDLLGQALLSSDVQDLLGADGEAKEGE